MFSILFAHGFEGSPTGSKPTFLRKKTDFPVYSPILHKLGWTIRDMTNVILSTIDKNEDINILIGSSMGGLAASIASSERPKRKIKLILMAPAYGCITGFTNNLNQNEIKRWKETGFHEYEHKGIGELIKLPWSFVEEGYSLEWTMPCHPTIIIHGRKDDIVPINNSIKAAKKCSFIKTLHFVNDDHRLKNSLQLMRKCVNQ